MGKIMNWLHQKFRSNDREIGSEAQRIYNKLQTLEPGTSEYGMCLSQYQNALEAENGRTDVHTNKVKVGLGVAVATLVPVVQCVLLNFTQSPKFEKVEQQAMNYGQRLIDEKLQPRQKPGKKN